MTRKGVLITCLLFIIFLYIVLTNEKILSTTFLPCGSHVYGKKIFELEFDSCYNLFNPSIVKQGQKYICCVRCSTLTQKNLLLYMYRFINPDSFIVFVEIENGRKKIIYPYQPTTKTLEDPRMIEYQGNYFISASEYDGKYNFPALLEYNKNYDFVRRIDYIKSDYFGDKAVTVQKNWCPFVHEEQLYLHTDTYPQWKVYRVDIFSGGLEKICDVDIQNKFSAVITKKIFLRCSTSWKDYGQFYICGLHTKTKNKIPTYRSALVLIDKKSFVPVQITDFFCLGGNHDRTQFLSGLEVDDFNVILAYGLNDAKMCIKSIPKYSLKFMPLAEI